MTLKEIYNVVTCNKSREMTFERFKQAVSIIEDKYEYKYCPYCGQEKEGILFTDANSRKICN